MKKMYMLRHRWMKMSTQKDKEIQELLVIQSDAGVAVLWTKPAWPWQSPAAFFMWSANPREYPEPIFLTFSRVHVWKQLKCQPCGGCTPPISQCPLGLAPDPERISSLDGSMDVLIPHFLFLPFSIIFFIYHSHDQFNHSSLLPISSFLCDKWILSATESLSIYRPHGKTSKSAVKLCVCASAGVC